MPYSREHANVRGYEGLALDPFLRARLQSYSFRPVEQNEEEGPESLLKVIASEDLPLSLPLEHLSQAYALDGSAAALPEDVFPFEVTAVKLGAVRQDLRAWRALNSQRGPLNPQALSTIYAHYAPLTLLPGEGVYGETPGEDLWQDKFRQELHATFKHFHVPFGGEGQNLLDTLRRLAPPSVKTRCIACQEAGRLTPEENFIDLSSPAAHCGACYREAHFTDFLFTESWLREGKSASLPLALMLIMERLMMFGLMDRCEDLTSSVFFIDGPLAFYSTYSLNEYFLKRVQRMREVPLLIGFEKTGTYARWAKSAPVQERLEPGHVAMVTDEAITALKGLSEAGKSDRTYTFGRRFFYRSLDGQRTFVFTLPPATGAVREEEAWARYPHLRTLCALIEEQTTAAFGPQVAALELIAEANHTASLPTKLSTSFLADLLRDVHAPENELSL